VGIGDRDLVAGACAGSPPCRAAAGTGGRHRHDCPGPCRCRDHQHQAPDPARAPRASGRVRPAAPARLCAPGTSPARPNTVKARSRPSWIRRPGPAIYAGPSPAAITVRSCDASGMTNSLRQRARALPAVAQRDKRHMAISSNNYRSPTRCSAVLPPVHGYLHADRLVLAAFVAVCDVTGRCMSEESRHSSWWQFRPWVWSIRHSASPRRVGRGRSACGPRAGARRRSPLVLVAGQAASGGCWRRVVWGCLRGGG
jgi:hypothetical protein